MNNNQSAIADPPKLNLEDYLDNPSLLQTRQGKVPKKISHCRNRERQEICFNVYFSLGGFNHKYTREGRLYSIAHFIDDPTHPADLILRENAGDIKDERMHERVFTEKPRPLSLVLGRDLRLTSLLPKTTLKIPMPPCKPPKTGEFFPSDILLMGPTKTGK